MKKGVSLPFRRNREPLLQIENHVSSLEKKRSCPNIIFLRVVAGFLVAPFILICQLFSFFFFCEFNSVRERLFGFRLEAIFKSN